MGFSDKQKQILRFPYTDYSGLICDGAVRSGKTSVMSLSFVLWAMGNFDKNNFAFCGKSVGAVERNVVRPLLDIVYLRDNFSISYNRSGHVLTIKRGGCENLFYLFGGKDESSYTLIQGITLAGVLFDEVALMPRSFVEQAMARCSVLGSKFWFNCNPESPGHWFYKEWICHSDEHNALYLHFTMADNPGLDQTIKDRYETMYSGVFYDRYIRGLWVVAEGLIYDMFDEKANTFTEDEIPIWLFNTAEKFIACDYGTTNPMRYLEIWDDGDKLYVNKEYDWNSRETGRQKTDKEYADDLLAFMGEQQCPLIVDPSAASFIAECRSRGFYVIPANNAVLDGIRKTSSLLARRKILINKRCEALLTELYSYCWDDKAAMRGEERPVKDCDHSLDALRYMVNYLPDWRIE